MYIFLSYSIQVDTLGQTGPLWVVQNGIVIYQKHLFLIHLKHLLQREWTFIFYVFLLLLSSFLWGNDNLWGLKFLSFTEREFPLYRLYRQAIHSILTGIFCTQKAILEALEYFKKILNQFLPWRRMKSKWYLRKEIILWKKSENFAFVNVV
jgi:hypothetical protein